MPKKSSSATGPVYEEFWQAPARFWKRELQDWEIDLVHVRLHASCRGAWESLTLRTERRCIEAALIIYHCRLWLPSVTRTLQLI